jgi:hypothetical protein
MQRIAPQAEEFVTKILFDEKPLFISDEASVWDVSLGPAQMSLSIAVSTFMVCACRSQISESLSGG